MFAFSRFCSRRTRLISVTWREEPHLKRSSSLCPLEEEEGFTCLLPCSFGSPGTQELLQTSPQMNSWPVVFDSLQDLVDHVNDFHVKPEKDSGYCCHWEGCARKGRGFNARCVALPFCDAICNVLMLVLRGALNS